MTHDELLDELEQHMDRLASIIDQQVAWFAENDRKFGTHTDPWVMRYANGELILAPLLAARTNALAAWAILNETGKA